MIRGTEQTFKFTTNYDFKDINRIVAVFSQPHNNGTTSAPMPITKYYDKKAEKVDAWSETGKDTTKTYYVDTKYYRYDSTRSRFEPSDTIPTESTISGGTIAVYPVADNSGVHISKAYKCDKSYYQYDPSTEKWNISSTKPDDALTELSQAGVDNIPSATDKKRACVYKQSYHRYDGSKWETSTTEILPIKEINYWDSSEESSLDQDKTYCALETYYKYVSGSWMSYGRPEKVRVLNDDCDQSKVYMMEELYYQYNVETDQFEKTGVREVYYQYNTTTKQWEECECPCLDAVEIDLWVNTDTHDNSKIYVCKNVYYRYNAGSVPQAWEPSNNMLVPVIEIDEWVNDGTVYYDTSKIYMCPTRYYQYNIAKEVWEEVEEVVQPQIVSLDYWTDPIDRDKSNIYLCGPTYFQYDSKKSEWVSSPSFNLQLEVIDDPSKATDQSKIYECTPTYYIYKDNGWDDTKNISDAIRNDGFAQVEDDPKSFVIKLSAEETTRFNTKYKGRVQATINNISHPIEYFSVYPTLIDEIPSNT